ncbi:hypothetical protein P8452_20131 [Trifolium repens]|nr:hypothetical protein P8452_20131 [Trifolium repens]
MIVRVMEKLRKLRFLNSRIPFLSQLIFFVRFSKVYKKQSTWLSWKFRFHRHLIHSLKLKNRMQLERKDKELGKIIQLQGDQRKNVSQFLVKAGLVMKDQIKIHGF